MPYLWLTLLLCTVTYWLTVVFTKRYFNSLVYLFFGVLFSVIPTIIWIDSGNRFIFNYTLSSGSFLLPSLYVILAFLFTAIGYIFAVRKLKYTQIYVPHRAPTERRYRVWAVLFLVTGMLLLYRLYGELGLHVFISSPRLFYQNSRAGDGISYFGSTGLILLSYLFFLIRTKSSRARIIWTAVFMLLSYPYGSKQMLLRYIVILILYNQFVDRKSDRKNFLYASLGIVALVLSFSIYFIGGSLQWSQLAQFIAGYSDYLRNFAVLTSYFSNLGLHHTWGINTLQGLFLSFVPRALFPAKPEYFAQLFISYSLPYYHELTVLKMGAPSFGPYGSMYFDFGNLALELVIIKSAFTGFLIGYFESKFSSTRSMSSLIFYLYFVGFPIIQTGVGSMLIPTVALAIIMRFMLGRSRNRDNLLGNIIGPPHNPQVERSGGATEYARSLL